MSFDLRLLITLSMMGEGCQRTWLWHIVPTQLSIPFHRQSKILPRCLISASFL